jgi:hypothetical protein
VRNGLGGHMPAFPPSKVNDDELETLVAYLDALRRLDVSRYGVVGYRRRTAWRARWNFAAAGAHNEPQAPRDAIALAHYMLSHLDHRLHHRTLK